MKRIKLTRSEYYTNLVQTLTKPARNTLESQRRYDNFCSKTTSKILRKIESKINYKYKNNVNLFVKNDNLIKYFYIIELLNDIKNKNLHCKIDNIYRSVMLDIKIDDVLPVLHMLGKYKMFLNEQICQNIKKLFIYFTQKPVIKNDKDIKAVEYLLNDYIDHFKDYRQQINIVLAPYSYRDLSLFYYSLHCYGKLTKNYYKIFCYNTGILYILCSFLILNIFLDERLCFLQNYDFCYLCHCK